MTGVTDGYQVARFDDTVFVRVLGLANMKNAPVLDAFLRQECASGLRRACIDLSVCKGMDSTFMGTLVGHHMRMSDDGGDIVIVNPSAGNMRLLAMLGVSEVLTVVEKEVATDAEWVVLVAEQGVSPLERADMMKSAHEHLVRINDANKAKFNPFLEALERDLQRLRSAEPKSDSTSS